MVRNKLFCVAEGASIDEQTKVTSIFAILEYIQASSFPIFLQHATAVAFFERESNDPAVLQGRFDVTLNGQSVVGKPVTIDFQGKLRTRLIVRIQNIPIPGPGTLRFTMALTGLEPVETDIKVDLTANPEMTMAQG